MSGKGRAVICGVFLQLVGACAGDSAGLGDAAGDTALVDAHDTTAGDAASVDVRDAADDAIVIVDVSDTEMTDASDAASDAATIDAIDASDDTAVADARDDTARDADDPEDTFAPEDTPSTDTLIPDDTASAPLGGNGGGALSAPGEPFPIEGYGAGTLGGWQDGSAEVWVTSLDDAGPGTLREALASGGAPRVVRFAVDGAIPLSGPLLVPSNISIDGRGRDVVLRGKGLVLGGADHVILVGFGLEDVGPDTEDGVQIGHPEDVAEHVVLDHLRFEQHGDGGDSKKVDEAISVVFGARDITIAWCRFVAWEKVMLFGNGDAPAALDGQIRVTVHHNWAHATGRRHPQARYGTYDFYNNFWDDWRMYGWLWEAPYRESFGAQAQDGARLRFEQNIVRRDPHPYDLLSQANDITRCESGGIIDALGTLVLPDSTAPLVSGTGCPTVFSPVLRPYPATVDPATSALRALLEAGTGDTL